ncbi:MAG: DAK2 domain-containing protein, partial [Clostridia bacterium]|nr:DAK2 domain-containing protein [Clostridia bacterium]
MLQVNAKQFYQMMANASAQLERESDSINNLNVFPVPDGDTGSNMSRTMEGVSQFDGDFSSLGHCAKSIADAMLRCARGNSGVILSVFFRGFAKGLGDTKTADAMQIARAMQNGVKSAYGAVMNPTEGTILSVMHAAAVRAAKDAERHADISAEKLFENMVKAAQEALDRTPEQLPILKQAGVVDAGGYGFLTILGAMSASLEQRDDVAFRYEAPAKPKKAAKISAAAASDSDIIYPYCTECIIEKSESFAGEDKTGEFHKFVLGAGDSVVFVEDEEIVKVHVHTSDPGAVLSEALKYGSLATVKIENMRNQHTELSRGAREESVRRTFSKPYGMVAVANGDGICDVLCDLGVDEVVQGGQTMNPSTEEMIAAIEKIDAQTVILLPNNSNIIMVAQQAAQVYEDSDRTVLVVPSKSLPQGITALCAFDENQTAEENLENMTAALANVKTLTTTCAIRDAEIDGLKIRRGQHLGL